MARFFVEPQNISDHRVVITGPDAKHIGKVLRLKVGATVIILDGTGNQYRAVISEVTRDQVLLKLLERQQAGGEPPIKIVLAQCLPKGDKLEMVIQKGTELGVSSFVPLKCSRSVVKLDRHKETQRRERWQRVAMEAAKQCRRALIPQVHSPLALAELLKQIPPEAAVLMPYEGETAVSIEKALSSIEKKQQFYIIIGPEGGFAPEEVALAQELGAQTLSLGPRIMRTETAGLALVSVIMYQFGDWS